MNSNFYFVFLLFALLQIVSLFLFFKENSPDPFSSSLIKFKPQQEIPVVQIYLGACPKNLRLSLWQSRQFNGRVVLIGDSEECKQFASSNSIIYEDYSKFSKLSQEFGSIFPHHKSWENDRRRFELQCFQRWFILQEYMEKNNIPRAFIEDSDTMLYVNVTEMSESYWKDIPLIYMQAYEHATGVFALLDFEALSDLCNFIQQLFIQQVLIEYYDKPDWFVKLNDMTAFYYYAERRGLSQLPKFNASTFIELKGGKLFDYNFGTPGEFKSVGGVKEVTWINGLPHVRYSTSNSDQLIGIFGLHFQGLTKKLMSWYRRTSNHWQESLRCTCNNAPCSNCWDIPQQQPNYIYHSILANQFDVEVVGGWRTCLLKLTNDSIVYSFGPSDDLFWEEELIRRYGLKVFHFNPNLSSQHNSNLLKLYPYQLGSKDGLKNSIPQFRLQTIMTMLDHGWVDIIKLDGSVTDFTALLDDPTARKYIAAGQILVNFRKKWKQKKWEVLGMIVNQSFWKYYVDEENEEALFIRSMFF